MFPVFPIDPEGRRKTPALVACVALVVLMLACTLFQALHSRPNEHLQHFAGVLRPGPPTYDRVKSDLYVRAGRSLESGDAQSAETLYREVIAKYPNDPRGYNALGACLVFQKRFDEARTNYLHALHLDSQSERALYGLGCVAYDENRYDDAKDDLEKALLLNDEDNLCHRLLGIVDVQLGDKQSAVLHFERAIALDPSDTATKERLHKLKE